MRYVYCTHKRKSSRRYRGILYYLPQKKSAIFIVYIMAHFGIQIHFTFQFEFYLPQTQSVHKTKHTFFGPQFRLQSISYLDAKMVVNIQRSLSMLTLLCVQYIHRFPKDWKFELRFMCKIFPVYFIFHFALFWISFPSFFVKYRTRVNDAKYKMKKLRKRNIMVSIQVKPNANFVRTTIKNSYRYALQWEKEHKIQSNSCVRSQTQCSRVYFMVM